MTELSDSEIALVAFVCALFGAAIVAAVLDWVWP